ncbi:MAG TPA: hypothetical protein VNG91_01480 [Terriglobia bacterium]|nr:hypothetical protein [Terriglobia bacterium]
MKEDKGVKAALFLSAVAILLLAPSAQGRSRNTTPFEYVGGTTSMPGGCEGKLEVTEADLVFRCGEGSISVPYDSITRMEYRPQISKQIRKMKLDWAVKPPSSYSRNKAYFSVLYSEKGQTHAMVLKAPPEAMRPYMAEIDLRTGRPIHSRQD